jgi:plastocyanin domain-containing protein
MLLKKIKTQEQALALRETPKKKGEYQFTCGMGMMRGKLIVG